MKDQTPKRPDLNLAQDFSRGNELYIYEFNEQSTRFKTAADIRRAYTEGFTCFLFKFKFHGRKFEDRQALPPGAGFDETDAFEMGEYAYDRFLATVAKLAEQERTGRREVIRGEVIRDD
ncbi:MAG: hypothetical protein QG619_931 [Pseudomonadota bacterium]|nr:hypothetical protein [Pseudomonadota bacterium]